MRSSGWIDRNGKYYGVCSAGHSRFAEARGFKEDELVEFEGWIKVSGGGLHIFASYWSERKPTQAQIDKVYKWLKKAVKSFHNPERRFKEEWQEFNERYIDKGY